MRLHSCRVLTMKRKRNQGFISPSVHKQHVSLALDGKVLLKGHFCKHCGVPTSPAIRKGSVFLGAGCGDVSRHKPTALAGVTPAVNVKLPDPDVGAVSVFISTALLSKKVNYGNEALQ